MICAFRALPWAPVGMARATFIPQKQMARENTRTRVVLIYRGYEVRTGIAYTVGTTVIMMGRFIAMHPDTAEQLLERGLLEAKYLR